MPSETREGFVEGAKTKKSKESENEDEDKD
jgi:hypothetical protein